MTVVAGAGTYDTRESIALAEAAANAGCDGVMAVTPYYSKPPQRGVAAHMRAIADATDLPLMLYNIPGRTATRIEIDTLKQLAQHPRIVAVKDAVGDIEWTSRAIREMPEGFAFYSGNDGDTKDIVAANGVGVVSSDRPPRRTGGRRDGGCRVRRGLGQGERAARPHRSPHEGAVLGAESHAAQGRVDRVLGFGR